MKVNENIAMFTKLNNHTYLKQNSYLMNRLTAMFITAFLSFTAYLHIWDCYET